MLFKSFLAAASTTSRSDLLDFQKPFAINHPPIAEFVDAVRAIKPTAIVGVSTVPKLFNQQVIEAMAEINERPIIFPYSNPTSRSECTAEEAYRWSDGRAIVASGSPFPPVEINGRTFVPGQGNNVYVFPALGMAVFATEAGRVTDEHRRRALVHLNSCSGCRRPSPSPSREWVP